MKKTNVKKIISLEDDRDLRVAMKLQLEYLHFEVTAFENGTDLLRYVRNVPERPDLLILDYQLPDSTGSEIARQVRQMFDGPEIPIIFISAEHNLSEIAKEFQTVGYLPKPLKFNDLRELLNISFTE